MDVFNKYLKGKKLILFIIFSITMAVLTLSTYNAVQISKLENKITVNEKKLDHLIDIPNLHQQHFRAMDQKIDNISNQLATMLQINKVHFTQVTDLMEQKFAAAIAILERLIHTAYDHRLAARALHHNTLLKIVKYVNEVSKKSKLFSFINEPSDLFLIKTLYIYRPDKNTFVLILHMPLVSPHNLIPLYEFLPLPVHFNFSSNVSITFDLTT